MLEHYTLCKAIREISNAENYLLSYDHVFSIV